MQFEINATKRDVQGSSASRRLRRAGRVPGIIYGGANAPQMIEFDHNELFQAMRKEVFRSSVVNMNIDGAKELCLLRDVQMHAYKLQIKHVDFQRIDAELLEIGQRGVAGAKIVEGEADAECMAGFNDVTDPIDVFDCHGFDDLEFHTAA